MDDDKAAVGQSAENRTGDIHSAFFYGNVHIGPGMRSGHVLTQLDCRNPGMIKEVRCIGASTNYQN